MARKRGIVGDPTDPRGMNRAIGDFCESLRVSNYSESTAHYRFMVLTTFSEWLADRSITRPSEVTKPILERYQRALYHHRKPNGRPLTFGSQYSKLVAVRSFFRWLARQNRILYNPASELDLPRLERRLPKHVLTADEAETVLSQANGSTAMSLRDRAIMEVLYSTGMRRMEVLGLRLYDLDTDRGTLVIRQGKGRKDRVVPIGERAILWCERYLAEVRSRYVLEPDDGFIFLTAEGTSFTSGRLTALVRGYVNAAGLDKHGSCHLFRHTCATLMLEAGADIRFIQQLLGHADIGTTQIYTQVSIRHLKRIHTATHPSAVAERTRDVGQVPGAAELLASLSAEEDAEDVA